MKKLFISIVIGLFLVVGVAGFSTPAAAGGYSAGAVVVVDPTMPTTIVAVLLQSGFSQANATALSATVGELLSSAGLLGVDTSGVFPIDRNTLQSWGLGDADVLDAALAGIPDILYIAIVASVLNNDPAIGHAIRFDVEVPSIAPTVLGSVILPYDLVMDPVAFIGTLGIDLGGLTL